MRYFGAIASAFALFVTFGNLPATAFQQEQVGGAKVESNSSASASHATTPDTSSGLSGSGVATGAGSAESSGPKLSIPGLGTVGVLPKMDFGLELLYGAKETTPDVTEPDDESDDLRIRGSIKHRF